MSRDVRFNLPAGPVIAQESDGVVRARGIPYATAARFARPVPVPPWAEPLRADRPGPGSPQISSSLLAHVIGEHNDGLVAGEDCQRLSLTIPADRESGELLPVMVWFHGGSYTTGAGDLEVYSAPDLVREQRVIVVSVTYRLGILGYLGLPGIAPANLGLLDQVAAIQWIAANIEAFGGDPAAITLFGQSAGADAVAHLMISDGARGLFQRAILQSPPLGVTAGRGRMTRAMAATLLAEAGHAGHDPGESLAEADLEDLMQWQGRVLARAGRFGVVSAMPFGVAYGEAPVPTEKDRNSAWDEIAPEIDIMIGSTTAEADFFVLAVPEISSVRGTTLLSGPLGRGLSATLTRRIYTTPIREFAQRYRAAGGNAIRYRMTWEPQGSIYGAAHVTDLPLIFSTQSVWDGTNLLGAHPWEDVQRRGRAVRAIWGSFARTGRVPTALGAAAADTLQLERG